MSLVNDLLVELDRNRNGAKRSDAEPLAGLAPSKPRPRQATSPSRHLPAAVTLIAAGCAGFAFARLDAGVPSQETTAASSVEIARAGTSEVLPEVSAPRPSPRLGTLHSNSSLPSFASPVQDLRIDRPIALKAIRVKPSGQSTRVEITTDRSPDYRIEAGREAGDFEILLESTALHEALPVLDLFGTAIRSIQTLREKNAIRLQFTLDSDARVQSQRIENAEGAVVIIDFQPATHTAKAAPSSKTNHRAKRSTLRKLGATATGTPTTTATAESTEAERPGTFTTQKTRTTSQARGNESESGAMTIARSSRDQQRVDLEDARQRGQRAIKEARAAKKSGDLETATRLYLKARTAAPNNAQAIIEGAFTLVEDGRMNEALTLIRAARKNAPKQTGYLMAHAQIVAESDLAAAIQLLNEARLSIPTSPEVHALTAAYLQKNGQHDSAIERYESILRRFPNKPKHWMGLGISLEARGRGAEALDVYRIALQLGELPGSSRGWVSARIAALSKES
ncbi:MAG: tetratricopeptide repeat protein [Myxococcota bacterium]